jgi:hypothetical protein
MKTSRPIHSGARLCASVVLIGTTACFNLSDLDVDGGVRGDSGAPQPRNSTSDGTSNISQEGGSSVPPDPRTPGNGEPTPDSTSAPIDPTPPDTSPKIDASAPPVSLPKDAGAAESSAPKPDAEPPPVVNTRPPGFFFDRNLEDFTYGPTTDAALKRNDLLVWDGTDGHLNRGSAKLTLPYTALAQKYSFSMRPAPPMNFKGKFLHVWIRLDVATGAKPNVSLQFYAQTGPGYTFADGGFFAALPSNKWQEFTLNMDFPQGTKAPGTWDPRDVREFGLELKSSEDASFLGPAKVHIDSLTIEDR